MEPPWEWVDGDPISAVRFGFGLGILVGIGFGLGAFLLANLASAYLAGWPAISTNDLVPYVLLLVAAQLLYQFGIPRRYPVVGRLAISPTGLKLVLPGRTATVAWTKVRVGLDWVDAPHGLPSQRYKLTESQMDRLTRFLRIG
jgi:hypothetical protein